ncbi:MAG: hypothetical protein LBF59_01440 [Prevotellaceae bacterium]|nr:hypothetical protein [Prevotellaceae bacterium]
MTTTALSGVEDAVETQYIASLQIDAIDDALDDHSIVRCRDAKYCISLHLIASHCISSRLINDVFDDRTLLVFSF